MRFRVWLFAAILMSSAGVQAETLNNHAIVALSASGIGEEAVIAKINGSAASYDLSTDGLIALKKSGVSGKVIAAMIRAATRQQEAILSLDSPDPRVPHAPGIYLLDEVDQPEKMIPVEASIPSQVKTGGLFGYAFSGGLLSMHLKAVVQGQTANVGTTERRPKFYFYLGQVAATQAHANPFMVYTTRTMLVTASPDEFSLIRLRSRTGHREAVIGKLNFRGARTGLMDRDRVEFEYREIGAGVFEVALKQAISPGEYAFIYQDSRHTRIFGFAVK